MPDITSFRTSNNILYLEGHVFDLIVGSWASLSRSINSLQDGKLNDLTLQKISLENTFHEPPALKIHHKTTVENGWFYVVLEGLLYK